VFFGPGGGGPGGPPLTPQIDNGKPNDDETQTDADTPDTAAINHGGTNVPPGFPPLLVEDFDTPSTATTVGDATIIAPPGQGPTERTIVMTGPPGLYRYMCTVHPWMQGTIRVVKYGAYSDVRSVDPKEVTRAPHRTEATARVRRAGV
jgi:hypothetical protein